MGKRVRAGGDRPKQRNRNIRYRSKVQPDPDLVRDNQQPEMALPSEPPLVAPITATKVETVTQSPSPPVSSPKQRSAFSGDPMWAARRLRVDATLAGAFGLIAVGMYQGGSMASIVVGPGLTAIVAILGIYMGVAETGRVFGVMGSSTTTATSTAVKGVTA